MIQLTPPPGAIVLFDGTNLDQWTSVDVVAGSHVPLQRPPQGPKRDSPKPADRGPVWVDSNVYAPADRRPNWTIEDDELNVGNDNIMTRESFGDCFLHMEFMVPHAPEETSQGRGNSGVFLQLRYEIQILDSYALEPPDDGDCGSIYRQHAPLLYACKPPREWQTYDVFFRGARLDDSGNVTNHARMTVLQNDIIIHNNAQLVGPTGHSDEGDYGPAPVMLQDGTVFRKRVLKYV